MISRWIAAVGAVLVLVLSLSCAKTQKATQKVTLRGGIIMQSGDVKPLVRTKFVVYGAGHLPHVQLSEIPQRLTLTLQSIEKIPIFENSCMKAKALKRRDKGKNSGA